MQIVITKDDALETLATNLGLIMAAKGIGVRELARLSANDPMTISRLKNRACLPTVDSLLRIAESVGVSLDELFRKKTSSRRQAESLTAAFLFGTLPN